MVYSFYFWFICILLWHKCYFVLMWLFEGGDSPAFSFFTIALILVTRNLFLNSCASSMISLRYLHCMSMGPLRLLNWASTCSSTEKIIIRSIVLRHFTTFYYPASRGIFKLSLHKSCRICLSMHQSLLRSNTTLK